MVPLIVVEPPPEQRWMSHWRPVQGPPLPLEPVTPERFTAPVDPVTLVPAPAPFAARPPPPPPAESPPAPLVPLPNRLPELLPHPVDQATASVQGTAKTARARRETGMASSSGTS